MPKADPHHLDRTTTGARTARPTTRERLHRISTGPQYHSRRARRHRVRPPQPGQERMPVLLPRVRDTTGARSARCITRGSPLPQRSDRPPPMLTPHPRVAHPRILPISHNSLFSRSQLTRLFSTRVPIRYPIRYPIIACFRAASSRTRAATRAGPSSTTTRGSTAPTCWRTPLSRQILSPTAGTGACRAPLWIFGTC